MIKHYRDASGNYLGGYDGAAPAAGIEVSVIPVNAGATWNGAGWDEPVVVVPVVTQFSSKTFFDRFTDIEKADIVAATLVSIPLKIFYDTMWGADYVDVEHLETIAGIDALIAATLLDASRKDEVLATA